MYTPETISRKRKMAVASLFFTNGIVFGTWAVNIPVIAHAFHLSHWQLSVVLLTMGVAAVSIMSLTGYLVHIFGSRGISILSCLLFPIALCLAFAAQNHLVLLVSVSLLGAANGSMDVSMNDQGRLLGARGSGSVMSLLHAFSSIGSLAGAALSFWCIGQKYPPATLAYALLGVTLVSSWRLFPHLAVDADTSDRRKNRPTKGELCNGRLLMFGILSFLTMMTDGIIADWSTLYLESLSVSHPTAILGYSAFAIFMIAGRILGGRVAAVIGDRAMIAIGGSLMSASMAIALFSPNLAAKLLGFGLLGLAMANLVPIIFCNAGQMENVSGSIGTAFVSVCGYSGFVAGPPLVGATAEALGLDRALLLVAAVGVTLICAAGLFRGRKCPPAQRDFS
ncbi:MULTISPECIES: MFS transporter [Rhizobium]|uniref:MFS transporter n=1 Tax=Rhizobium TaxID=379 RepID=UPI0007E54F2C|nr:MULTISPECIES: MFS transporter [Rhizobium]MBY5579201.1 MFS transporter [Rhizobium leguminosarum]